MHRPTHTTHIRISHVHTRIVVSVTDKNGDNLKLVLLPGGCLLHRSGPKYSSGKKGLQVIMLDTQDLPQSMELRVQPDRRRQAVWTMPGARSSARQSAVGVVPELYIRYSRLHVSAAAFRK